MELRAIRQVRSGKGQHCLAARRGQRRGICREPEVGHCWGWLRAALPDRHIDLPVVRDGQCVDAVFIRFRVERIVGELGAALLNTCLLYTSHTLDAGAYLPRALKQMLDGTLGIFAERIGRQLFKLAVEQNVNNHILASDTDIDAARYMKMHALSMDQVRGTNGKISFVDVLQQEKAL